MCHINRVMGTGCSTHIPKQDGGGAKACTEIRLLASKMMLADGKLDTKTECTKCKEHTKQNTLCKSVPVGVIFFTSNEGTRESGKI
jgi:hypothetical protein